MNQSTKSGSCILPAEAAEAAGRYKQAAKVYGRLARMYTEKANVALLLSKQARCQLLAGKIHVAKENYEKLLTGISALYFL